MGWLGLVAKYFYRQQIGFFGDIYFIGLINDMSETLDSLIFRKTLNK
jgi:hypothetical protein